MAQVSQEKRKLSLATPLGEDALLLTGFSGQEALSRLFHYRLEMFSLEDNLDPTAIVGKAVTWTILPTTGTPRHFNAVVQRFSPGPKVSRGRLYRAEVVPWLWFLTRTANCRIFQHKSVPEIVQAIFDGLRFKDYKFLLRGSYPLRDYCVQYRETAFNFVSRLLEQEGIFYFFRHEEGKHTLVLADHTGAYKAGPASEAESWEPTFSFCSGKWTHTDYDFENPSINLQTSTSTIVPLADAPKYELFDYPGNYLKKQPQGEGYAKVRLEAQELEYEVARGTGENDNFTPGLKFTLAEHDKASGQEYVLTQVQHFAQDPSFFDAAKVAEYRNEFTCIPAKLTYRPPQQTPHPVVQGPQTAVVVGPKGEEIYCDKYGRIKVQFHWDREGKKDADSSCWMRVAHMAAGGGFGVLSIPRIGHEVVVDFLEGDPDQPLILGSVYNAGKMPPFSLPENRMFSGIKSKSLKGTPTANFSGLSFNDTAGSERVALYAEKDMMVNSEHDLKHHVGHYQHVQIGHTSLTTVGGLPGGGGSGGGGGAETSATTDDSGKTTDPSYGNWKTSNGLLSAQPGMAGAVIYGVNSQDTVGFMHQITIGAAYQICCNPLGYLGFIPNPLAAAGGPLLGMLGAIGGNVQLCFGTNTQAVYGPAITINHGPQITVTGAPWTATYFLAPLVPALSLAYELVFGAMYSKDDQASSRAELFAASVAVIGLANVALLTSETADRTAQVAKRAITAKTEDTLLSTCLGIADSSLLPDFMKKMIPDAKVDAQALKPELALTVMDDANSINVTDGVSLQLAKHVHLIAAKDPTAVPPDPNPSTVYIQAAGKGDDGVVFINGTKGITLTTGPTQLIELTQKHIKLQAGPLCSLTLDPLKGLTLKFGPNTFTIGLAEVKTDALIITTNGKVKVEEMSLLKKIVSTLTDAAVTLLNQK